jgi:hypothetical protein
MGVTGRHRYWEPEGRGPELYDLLEDREERVNLASSGLEIESRLERQRAARVSLTR